MKIRSHVPIEAIICHYRLTMVAGCPLLRFQAAKRPLKTLSALVRGAVSDVSSAQVPSDGRHENYAHAQLQRDVHEVHIIDLTIYINLPSLAVCCSNLTVS